MIYVPEEEHTIEIDGNRSIDLSDVLIAIGMPEEDREDFIDNNIGSKLSWGHPQQMTFANQFFLRDCLFEASDDKSLAKRLIELKIPGDVMIRIEM